MSAYLIYIRDIYFAHKNKMEDKFIFYRINDARPDKNLFHYNCALMLIWVRRELSTGVWIMLNPFYSPINVPTRL